MGVVLFCRLQLHVVAGIYVLSLIQRLLAVRSLKVCEETKVNFPTLLNLLVHCCVTYD